MSVRSCVSRFDLGAGAYYCPTEFRTDHPSAQIQTQWETCQTTGAQCLLDYTNTTDAETILAQTGCELGSISDYYVRQVLLAFL